MCYLDKVTMGHIVSMLWQGLTQVSGSPGSRQHNARSQPGLAGHIDIRTAVCLPSPSAITFSSSFQAWKVIFIFVQVSSSCCGLSSAKDGSPSAPSSTYYLILVEAFYCKKDDVLATSQNTRWHV